jgi:hypothetical protein
LGAPDPAAKDWRNLRDANGRLYGRVNRVQMLLELRSHSTTHVFDLKIILEAGQDETKEVK